MTAEQAHLSRRYVWYHFFRSMFFIGVLWLFFYRLFIDDRQIGLLDGAAFVIGLLAEIPSGALADMFGRARLVKIGLAMMAGGFALQGASSDFMGLFIGQVIFIAGFSFASGADEALFFDLLKFPENSHKWRDLVMKGTQYSRVGAFIALIIGGALYTYDFRLAWYINAGAFLTAMLIIWNIRDTPKKSSSHTIKQSINEYISTIKTGFVTFTKPALRAYLPIIIAVQGLFYTVGFGLLRPLLIDRFTFDAYSGSVIVAVASLLTIVVLAYIRKYNHRISEKQLIVTISLLSVAALLFSVAPIGKWGLFIVLFFHISEYVLQPFMSEILNRHAPSEQRATVLSVASFFHTVPYVILAPLIGYLSFVGQLEWYFVFWAGFIVAAVLYYVSSQRKDTVIEADVI